jgi:hypothetical protein
VQAASEYSQLRPKVIRTLARAAHSFLQKREKELKGASKKHRPGSSAKQAALQSYIYNLQHYLLPIFTDSSSQKYKLTIKNLLAGPVAEFSMYSKEFEPFIGKCILSVIEQSRRLGLREPLDVTAKCELAMSEHLSTRYLFGALRSLDRNYLDPELVERVERLYRNKVLSDESLYDPLLMTISKLPENRIKQWLKEANMDDDAANSLTGEKLLGYARQNGFFGHSQDEPKANFFFMMGYFKAIRNKPHHEFEPYRLGHAIDAILLTNYLLKSISQNPDK